jgi:hypothetical protein
VDRGDQLEVYKDEAADGAPIVDDSPARRHRSWRSSPTAR